MRHFNERLDKIIVGLCCIVTEVIMIPILIVLIVFDTITRKENIMDSFKARCVRPVKDTIKREVRWYYHPEEDPVYRKAKGL